MAVLEYHLITRQKLDIDLLEIIDPKESLNLLKDKIDLLEQ